VPQGIKVIRREVLLGNNYGVIIDKHRSDNSPFSIVIVGRYSALVLRLHPLLALLGFIGFAAIFALRFRTSGFFRRNSSSCRIGNGFCRGFCQGFCH
jgi:hypothetical protein